MIINCKFCKKEFNVGIYYVNRRKYCSRKCCDEAKIGMKMSTEHRKKISEGIKKHLPSTAYKKNRPEIPGRVEALRRGEKHQNWKGDEVGYTAIHDWVRSKMGKADHCSFDPEHKSHHFEWANISGSYLRDVDDWAQLCVKCHRQYDMIRNGYVLAGKKVSREGGLSWPV